MELRKRVEEKRKKIIEKLLQMGIYKGLDQRQLYELKLSELEDLYRKTPIL